MNSKVAANTLVVSFGSTALLFLIYSQFVLPTASITTSQVLTLFVLGTSLTTWANFHKKNQQLVRLLVPALWSLWLTQFALWLSGVLHSSTVLSIENQVILVATSSASVLWWPITRNVTKNWKWWRWADPGVESVLLWLVSFVSWISVQDKLWSWCQQQFRFGFDAQNFVTWVFTAHKGLLPLRDVFYWYGLGAYYRDAHPAVFVLGVMVLALLLVAWFMVIKTATKQSYTALASWLLTLLYLQSTMSVGKEAWFRYGSGAVLVGATGLALEHKKNNWWLLLLGFLCGNLLVLLQDQGIYTTFVFMGLLVVMVFSKFKWQTVLKASLYWSLGWAVGVLIWMLWLTPYNLVWPFWDNFQQIGALSEFAKLPHTIQYQQPKSVLVLITLYILFLDVCVSWYSSFTKTSSSVSPRNYLLKTSWLFYLLLVQYKNITRGGIETQFLFLAIAVYALYFSQVAAVTKKQVLVVVAYLWVGVFSLMVVIPTATLSSLQRTLSTQALKQYHQLKWHTTTFLELDQCLTDSFAALYSSAPPEYQSITDWLKPKLDSRTAVFVWPETPYFYILLDQNPAPVFNIYDATPFLSQVRNIEYMEKNATEFVIMSTNTVPVQDQVPNVIRSPLMYQYLLTRYSAVQTFQSFVILQRINNPSQVSFLQQLLQSSEASYEEFKQSLLNIDFRELPKTWGTLVNQDQAVWTETALPENSWHVLPIESEFNQRFIQLRYVDQVKSELYSLELALTDSDGQIATASFTACFKDDVCNVDLKVLPLFYEDIKVRQVEINGAAGLVQWRTTDTIPASAADLTLRESLQKPR